MLCVSSDPLCGFVFKPVIVRKDIRKEYIKLRKIIIYHLIQNLKYVQKRTGIIRTAYYGNKKIYKTQSNKNLYTKY